MNWRRMGIEICELVVGMPAGREVGAAAPAGGGEGAPAGREVEEGELAPVRRREEVAGP